MKNLENYVLPEHTNNLYSEEASSSIALARDVAAKINELVDAYNSLASEDIAWKQTQEGKIRKGILYMKDNLIDTLRHLLNMYDNDLVKNMVLEEINKLTSLQIVTPQMFGAVGDGIVDDGDAIQAAADSLKDGGVLYFPPGVYLIRDSVIHIKYENITLMGNGLLRCARGFKPGRSHFKAFGLRMEGVDPTNDTRAFFIDNGVRWGGAPYLGYIKDFTFKDCTFSNFFYSVCAVGGAYTFDGTEEEIGYPVRDVVIENCHSTAIEGQNSGHFQCIQVENISYINNRTYGGQNASSYNAIKGNGYIRVIGNYDHNNKYASCEVENGSGKVIIANNTFNSKIWVDDAFDVVVNANTTEEGILVSVGSGNGDANNVIVTNNNCKNIRCERFGDYVGGLINHVNISGNNVKGNNTHGIWIHGTAVKRANVANNFISGENTNDIAIQRNEQLECMIRGNFGNGKFLLIAGIGGKVFAVDNYNMTTSGNREPLPVSHLERSFNGIRVSDGMYDWRINVNSSGEVTTTKY